MSRICGRCQTNQAVNVKGMPRCLDCKTSNAKATKAKLQSKYDSELAFSPEQRDCAECGTSFQAIHKRVCSRCVYKKHRSKLVEVDCPDCNGPMKNPTSPRCRSCAARLRVASRGGKAVDREYSHKTHMVNSYGYVLEYCPDHPKAYSGGYVFEHRLVMEEHLGRYLVKGENVHHKNGVRSDNRIENLELWVKTQPAGQRVEDLVEFAKGILERYGV